MNRQKQFRYISATSACRPSISQPPLPAAAGHFGRGYRKAVQRLLSLLLSSSGVWVTGGQVRQDTLPPCEGLRSSTDICFCFSQSPSTGTAETPQTTTSSCAGMQLPHTRGVHYLQIHQKFVKTGSLSQSQPEKLEKKQLPLQATGPNHMEHSIPCSPRHRARGTTAPPTSFPKLRGTRCPGKAASQQALVNELQV